MSRRMKNVLNKIRSTDNADATVITPIIDDHMEAVIEGITRQCGTHMMEISIRRQIRNQTSEHIHKRILNGKMVTSGGTEKFHIASITKMVIAVALIIAVEAKSNQNVDQNRYSKFKNIGGQSFTQVYNEHCGDLEKLRALPGNPKTYHLLLHCNGFLSANDLMVAPCETPFRTLAEVPQLLLRHTVREVIDGEKTWRRVYSNINYSAIAMLIDVLWDGDLDSFVRETLFRPLRMGSSSIGTPIDQPTGNTAYVVDSDRETHSIKQPIYRVDGAEAAAFGMYSTTEDLDKLFKFVIDTMFRRPTGIPEVQLDTFRRLINMTFHASASFCFTPLGLYTTLDCSTVGGLSINRLQFPDDEFCTYTVQSEQNELKIPVYYMAGSALGSSCATAVHFAEEECFAITVLTDTSGPVDAADHVIRCLLQNAVQWVYRVRHLPQPTQLVDVGSMAILNNERALDRWKARSKEMRQKMNNSVSGDMDIEGLYKAEDFNQHLSILKDKDGKTKITIYGAAQSISSRYFDLIWIDKVSIQICVPQHESVDVLCDWSNLVFRVEAEGQSVKTLTRVSSLQREMIFKRVN